MDKFTISIDLVHLLAAASEEYAGMDGSAAYMRRIDEAIAYIQERRVNRDLPGYCAGLELLAGATFWALQDAKAKIANDPLQAVTNKEQIHGT